MSKLVRDRIPEIIQREGKRPNIRVAEKRLNGHSISEFRGALLLKLQEEVVAEDLGESITRVEAVRHGKEVARGGFDKGIILL